MNSIHVKEKEQLVSILTKPLHMILLVIYTCTIAACGFGGGSEPTPTNTPEPVTVATPTPTPTPKPVIRIVPADTPPDVRELFIEPYPQSNCGGNSEATATFENEHVVVYNLELAGELRLRADGSLGIPGVGDVSVGAEVATYYSVAYGQQETKRFSLQLKTEPNSRVEHTLRHVELWDKGTIIVTANDQDYRFDYHFPRGYRIEQLETRSLLCTPTVTPVIESFATPTNQPRFTVNAALPWQETGIQVNATDLLKITYLDGEWTGQKESNGYHGPDPGPGFPAEECRPFPSQGPVLIGRVGAGSPFIIGIQYWGQPSVSGSLQLRMNDCDSWLNDNDGSIRVEIAIEQQAQPAATPTPIPTPTTYPTLTAVDQIPLVIPIVVPGNNENGVKVDIPASGLYQLRYRRGVFSPWPEGHPDDRGWATHIQAFKNREIEWGIAPSGFPGPIDYDAYIGAEGYNLIADEVINATTGKIVDLGPLNAGDYVNFVVVDVPGQYRDNRGSVEVEIIRISP